MIDYREHITIEPGKRGGQPCIRGMRITVYDILSYLAGGNTMDELLENFPGLKKEDVFASLAYAADAEKRISKIASWDIILSLLFDNNLSAKLVQLLSDCFPGSVHVVDIGLQESSDSEIWKYAKDKNLTIVSKDKDFYHMSSAFGSPPKLIWLILGNCKIVDTVDIIKMNQKEINSFMQSRKDMLVLERLEG